MSAILDREFATAEVTAAALGVSRARLKRLLRIAGPKVHAIQDGTRFVNKSGANGKFKRAVVTAKRRKQARAKAKKPAR